MGVRTDAIVSIVSPMVQAGVIREEQLPAAISALQKVSRGAPMATLQERMVVEKVGAALPSPAARVPKKKNLMPFLMVGGMLARAFVFK